MTAQGTRASMPALAARMAALALALAAVLLAMATPASAHGRASDATNYDSRVTAEPDVPGAEWDVLGGDELLLLDSPEVEVTIHGYSDEPYLRIGPDGVFRNTRSPATYLNEERYRIELPPGADADAEAEPNWERVSGDASHTWHDHRAHAMTTELPRRVAQDPSAHQLVQEWSVPVVVDGEEMALEGELHWVPGPAVWLWLAAGALVGLLAMAGLRSGDMRGLVRPAAVVLAAVAALNGARIIDDVAAMPLPASTMAMSSLQTALFVVIGLAGAWKGWRGGDGAATALGVGAAAILVGQGIPFVPVLSASQLTSLMPDWLSRLTAAASIGQAVGVGVVAVIGNRRMRVREPEDERVTEEPVGAGPAAEQG